MRDRIQDNAPRLHLSLDVSDLAAATAFYGRLFGVEPAKREADYAKFEVDEPPLVLGLQPGRGPARGRAGALNHLGLRFPDRAALQAAALRIELRGLQGSEEREVTCCYAVQDKLWVEDPDGNAWELYTVLEDVPAAGTTPGEGREAVRSAGCCAEGACGVG